MAYTYRIRIANSTQIQVEIRNNANQTIAEPSGRLTYDDAAKARLNALRQQAAAGAITAEEIRLFGELLFRTLFDDALRHDLFLRYERAIAEQTVLRVELDIDEQSCPDLASLPWEFLRTEENAQHGAIWFATHPNLLLSRRRAIWRAANPIRLRVREPLRIAVAVANPADLPKILYENVLTRLRQLAKTERIELLDPEIPATRRAVDDALERRPHIFHFIGHARFLDDQRREIGQVALMKANGETEWVNAAEFGELFTRHQPGIVLLQACETASLSASHPFIGIASQVVQQNIPAVIAMQYEVTNLTAQQFDVEFYCRLADNQPVDRAMQEGRRRIALGANSYGTRDFATPVLFMRGDGHLFLRQPGALTPDEQARLQAQAEQFRRDRRFDEAIKLFKDLRDFGTMTTEMEKTIASLYKQQAAEIAQDARRMEQNGAFDEAIAKWLELAANEGINVDEQVERLRRKSEQRRSLHALQQQLAQHIKALQGMFPVVANRLKRMQRDGIDDEGEILLEIVRQFLNGTLSAEDFIKNWNGAGANPSAASQPVRFQAIAQRLSHGEIIPVLGLQAPPDAVDTLAKQADYNDLPVPLSMISQYYQMTEFGRGMLLQNFRQAMPTPEKRPLSEAYRLLAGIPAHLLIISACYDTQLEACFMERGKPFVTITHTGITNNEPVRFALKYSDRAETEIVKDENDLSTLKPLERYSILYKICGCFDVALPESGDTTDAVTISEDDYFAFARVIDRLMPSYIARHIRGKSLLFLGSSLHDWHDRLVMKAVIETSRELSYAVQEAPTPYEIAFWKYHRVESYRMSPNRFIEQLEKHLHR